MTPAPAEGLVQGASIPREILFLPHRSGSRGSLAQAQGWCPLLCCSQFDQLPSLLHLPPLG